MSKYKVGDIVQIATAKEYRARGHVCFPGSAMDCYGGQLAIVVDVVKRIFGEGVCYKIVLEDKMFALPPKVLIEVGYVSDYLWYDDQLVEIEKLPDIEEDEFLCLLQS